MSLVPGGAWGWCWLASPRWVPWSSSCSTGPPYLNRQDGPDLLAGATPAHTSHEEPMDTAIPEPFTRALEDTSPQCS